MRMSERGNNGVGREESGMINSSTILIIFFFLLIALAISGGWGDG